MFGAALIDIELEISKRRWEDLMDVRARCGLRPRCDGGNPAGLTPCCPAHIAKEWVPATVTVAGVTVPAEVRLKGNPEDWRPEKKPQFVIRVDHDNDAARLHGLRRLNLEASPGDRSHVRNNLSLHLMRTVGVPAPRTNHARLKINGVVFGLYENIESVDDVFVRGRFGGRLGNLYKHGLPGERDVGSGPKTDLEALRSLFEQDGETVEKNAPCLVDVDNFLTEMAAEALLPASDNFLAESFNMFLYWDARRGFTVIPWDLDDVAYDDASPTTDPLNLAGLNGLPAAPENELGAQFRALMRVPAYQERYLAKLESIAAGAFSTLPAKADALCCAVRAELSKEREAQHPWRVLDSYVTLERFEAECADLVARLQCRRTWLDQWFHGELGPLCELGNPPPLSCANEPLGNSEGLVLNELSALSGRVELLNTGAGEASSAGLSIRTNGRTSALPPRRVSAGGRLVFDRSAHDLDFPEAGTLELLGVDEEPIDSLSWCAGVAEQSACRWPDGGEGEGVPCSPTFDAPNALSAAGPIAEVRALPSATLCPKEGCNTAFEPTDLALGSGDTVWVLAPAWHSVLQLSPAGELARFGGLPEPTGIASDAGGQLWVVDATSQSVRRLDPTAGWVNTVVFDDTLLGSPRDLAFSGAQWLLVDNNDGLYAFDGIVPESGVVLASQVSIAGTLGALWDGENIALDPSDGTAFVTSEDTGQVFEFSAVPGGVGAVVLAGSPASLSGKPTAIAIDPVRRALLVADNARDRILVHDLAATADPEFGLRGTVGAKGDGCADLAGPEGLATDGVRIAVSDTDNGRVIVYESSTVFEALSW